MAAKKPHQKKIEREKSIRIIWGSDENLSSIYVNQIQVSHGGETEFHITFGHLSPPLTFGLTEEEFPDKLTVKPVSKIIMSPDVMRAFVRILVENLANFENKTSKKVEKK